MDLRSFNLSQGQLDAVRDMIVARKLAYQPIIFADDLEVGEGWVFEAGANHSPRSGRVFWGGQPDNVRDIQVSPDDRLEFSRANAELREWYEDNIRVIAGLVDDVVQNDFLELGCNSGYFLHRLSQLGARAAIGLDYAYFGDVFEWFNGVLGTRASFIHAAWDSVGHRLVGADIPEVDVAINVSVTCHIADPLHLLAYLCQKARKAVFFMLLFADPADHERIREKLARLVHVPFRFERAGSRIIFFDPGEDYTAQSRLRLIRPVEAFQESTGVLVGASRPTSPGTV